jgi:hypothetical protein
LRYDTGEGSVGLTNEAIDVEQVPRWVTGDAQFREYGELCSTSSGVACSGEDRCDVLL